MPSATLTHPGARETRGLHGRDEARNAGPSFHTPTATEDTMSTTELNTATAAPIARRERRTRSSRS